MQYAQLNSNNSFKEVKTNMLTVWHANNYCTPEALIKDGKADLFKIVRVTQVDQPTFDSTTQNVSLEGAELIEGKWKQKWVITDLTPEQIEINTANAEAQAREVLKNQRTQAVTNIKVSTAAGNTFDGDEVSQGRMARAIIALSTGLAPSVTWILANNNTIEATSAELTEALVLSGQAQASIWVI